MTENVAMKYEAWGWNVLSIDGHNINEIREALVAAESETERPTLIIGHTVMGKGAKGPCRKPWRRCGRIRSPSSRRAARSSPNVARR